MKDVILQFSGVLREWGFNLSTEDISNTLLMLGRGGIESPELVRNILKTIMLKSREKEEIFDHLFDLFFFNMGKKDYFEKVETDDPLFLYLLTGDASRLLEKIDSFLNSIVESGFEIKNFNAFMWRAITFLRISDAKGDFERFLRKFLEEGKISEEEFDRMFKNAIENLERLRRSLAELIEMRLIERGYSRRERLNALMKKEFYSMNEEELRELRRLSRDLGRALRIILSMRKRRSKKGVLDVRKTIRNSLSTDGVPFFLNFRKRRVKKPKLIILSDVSNSMRHSVEFFMRLLMAIRGEFSSVKIFTFVSECVDVTDFLKTLDMSDFMERLYKGEFLNIYSYTNYGTSLHQFMEDFSSLLTRKTTVIFIGDARSNYSEPGEREIKEMKKRVKHIYWLNPEPIYAWFTGDSEMKTFLKYIDSACVVRSLQDIWNFILDLYRRTSATPLRITGTPSWFTV